MDKLSRIGKVAEFHEINFREWPILDFSRDKLSRKRAKFAEDNPVKVGIFESLNPWKTQKFLNSISELP